MKEYALVEERQNNTIKIESDFMKMMLQFAIAKEQSRFTFLILKLLSCLVSSETNSLTLSKPLGFWVSLKDR